MIMKKDSKTDQLSEDRTTAPIEPEKKTILVTIHGTGAGESSAAEDSWWLEGSHFLGKLKKRLDLESNRIEILPFLWEGGPNSEESRRTAGKRLYELLKSYDVEGIDYYLVCHSHGGSVAYSALLHSVDENQPLVRLKCWCTVGTPFLEYMRNRFLWQRLSPLELGAYMVCATATLVAVLSIITILLYPIVNSLISQIASLLLAKDLKLPASIINRDIPYFLPYFVAGFIAHGALLLWERWKGRAQSKISLSWITEKQKEAVLQRYSDTWVGLCHPEDEAVSALSNIKDVNEEFVKQKFLLPLIPFSQFVILLGWRFTPFDEMIWIQLNPFIERKLGAILGESAIFYISAIMYGLLILLFIFALGLLLKRIAFSLGKPASKWINNAVWSSIRENVWGDDVNQEDVIRIEAYPPRFGGKFRMMPNTMADSLSEHSSKSAIRTLVKVREILGMTTNNNKDGNKSSPGKGAMDLRSDLSKSLTWEELIHTSYFDVDNFIDLIALGLHRAGIAEFKDDFILTPEHELLRAWYDDDTSLGQG